MQTSVGVQLRAPKVARAFTSGVQRPKAARSAIVIRSLKVNLQSRRGRLPLS